MLLKNNLNKFWIAQYFMHKYRSISKSQRHHIGHLDNMNVV